MVSADMTSGAGREYFLVMEFASILVSDDLQAARRRSAPLSTAVDFFMGIPQIQDSPLRSRREGAYPPDPIRPGMLLKARAPVEAELFAGGAEKTWNISRPGGSAARTKGHVGADLAAPGVPADDDLQVALAFQEVLEAVADHLGLPLPLVVGVLLEGFGDLLGELEGVRHEGLGVELLLPSAAGHGGHYGRRPGD